MDHRRALRDYGLIRIGIGVAFIVAPRWMARQWIGIDGKGPATMFLARLFGARDVVLGLGVVAASRRGSAMRTWALVAAASDGADAVVSLAAIRHLPRRKMVSSALAAASGSANGLWLASRLREREL